MRKGILKGFEGSWGSGLGYLLIQDAETQVVERVPCDNGPTVRALNSAFGNAIGEGHTVNQSGFVGQEVFWDYDDMGLTMAGFCPVEEASEELIDAYEGQE